jgi:hypothetical protein
MPDCMIANGGGQLDIRYQSLLRCAYDAVIEKALKDLSQEAVYLGQVEGTCSYRNRNVVSKELFWKISSEVDVGWNSCLTRLSRTYPPTKLPSLLPCSALISPGLKQPR